MRGSFEFLEASLFLIVLTKDYGNSGCAHPYVSVFKTFL
jgi:hypothetical protein